ncbi:SRPBCC family protein [Leptolyngbya sp. FACHB-711]|uniref:SRPBCC family protein n=1 Tax=unclassified Leptolyngbya TaxID=2650499 RepID=UPI001689EBE3|nr:SRPBCC family protein [Leptolyngbya sp. FACHB-711]MBD1849885.1 SRPBCC family protein [Cyanobacteria bacterium FACHB-502]MBD2023649.1 SRPBCC family protein [Leptolyngbya sp. FACHB-711]
METVSGGNQENQPNQNQQGNVSEAEKWGSLITGGAMVLMGLSQRSLRGALMAMAGGAMAYHGATADKSLTDKVADAAGLGKGIKVERTVTIINKTPEELYEFWHNFENLPSFMKHLKSVTVTSPTRSHWVTSAPFGTEVAWDAEIVADQPNKLIGWASIEGSQVDNSGFVRFQPGPPGRGTEVKVVMEYNPPGGVVGAAIAKLFGEEAEQQIGDELRRFKMLMETGEIATTEGQPSGRK